MRHRHLLASSYRRNHRVFCGAVGVVLSDCETHLRGQNGSGWKVKPKTSGPIKVTCPDCLTAIAKLTRCDVSAL